MLYSEQRNNFMLLLPLAAVGTFALAYLVIGREMTALFQGIIAVFLLFVCFLSVRLSLILLIFSMLLSPEIAVGSTTSRDVTIRGEDLFLVCMTLGWLARIAIFKDIGFMRKNFLTKPMLIYIACATLSTALGVMRGDVNLLAGSFFVLKMMEYFVLYFLVVNYLADQKEIRSLLTMMLIVWGIVVLYGLAMVATGNDVAAPFEGSRAERNTLSGYLILVGAVAGGLLTRNENGKDKKWLVIILLGMFVVLLFSISRSGWISGIVCFMVLFMSSRDKNVFVLLICIAVLVIPFITPEAVTKRLEFTFHQYSAYDQQVELFGMRLDTSTSARFYSALLVLNRFPRHPFFGTGVTGFSFLDGQFFRVLAEMGLVGLSAFIWLLFKTHNILLQAKRELIDPRLAGMANGLYAGFWGLMFHAFSANTFIIVRICEPFWCLMGLTILALDFQKEGASPAPPVVPETVGGRRLYYERIR
jgi:hypothetical protein